MANAQPLVSDLAEHIIGSEIIKLAAEVNALIARGEPIHNLTIGDFNPNVFPIPDALTEAIAGAYRNHETNYPPADGMLVLRNAVSALLQARQGISYDASEIVISGGARPLIYAIYQTLVNEGEAVLFPVPSWNNNHYTYLTHARQQMVETAPENKFMPTAGELAPHIGSAALIALCSPLNPTGTTFRKDDLDAICNLVLAENEQRAADGRKPLYVLYDQIYWELTYGDIRHYDPVSLNPAMRPFTVFVDGISKSLAATGVRVGWAMGPKHIIDKMKSILSHIGAWAPKAEQSATGAYLANLDEYGGFITHRRNEIEERLRGFHAGIQSLKAEGHHVDSIVPEAAMYLTVKFALHGATTADGPTLATTADVTAYLLHEAKVALVPFFAFGSTQDSPWYRLSVGTCKTEHVEAIIANLRAALQKLTHPAT
ncbi:MAG: aminotransferase class I/II-fold pyridoxal phosphate-dependent enzyme [Candidatus Kapabacteria bacterium]|nr:aminotransferase class I/II-fold pyridoxal phosphate-dependent enzyme [Candidatus Kapabacteria bacterium]